MEGWREEGILLRHHHHHHKWLQKVMMVNNHLQCLLSLHFYPPVVWGSLKLIDDNDDVVYEGGLQGDCYAGVVQESLPYMYSSQPGGSPPSYDCSSPLSGVKKG